MGPKTRLYRKILLAVDGSEPAVLAAEVAIALARNTGASLAAVSVVHVPTALYSTTGVLTPGAPDLRGELSEYLHRQARGALSRVVDMAKSEGVAVETKVLRGHAVAEILKFVEKGGFGLLVVGSRGLSGISRLLMGSVSSALVQRAKTSVLVVR